MGANQLALYVDIKSISHNRGSGNNISENILLNKYENLWMPKSMKSQSLVIFLGRKVKPTVQSVGMRSLQHLAFH